MQALDMRSSAVRESLPQIESEGQITCGHNATDGQRINGWQHSLSVYTWQVRNTVGDILRINGWQHSPPVYTLQARDTLRTNGWQHSPPVYTPIRLSVVYPLHGV